MKTDNTPNPGQTDSEIIGHLVEAAQDAFWQRAAELAAEPFGISTGDLDPGATVAIEEAMTTAITSWVAANRTR